MNVSNRKCVRTLARRSLRASRTRNLIAVLAIALTTVLFTSLFTIALSINDGFQQANFRQVGGWSHGGFKYLTEGQFLQLRDDPLSQEWGLRRFVGMPVEVPFNKSHVEVGYSDPNQAHWMYCDPVVGRLPEEGTDEAATDTRVLSCWGSRRSWGRSSLSPLRWTAMRRPRPSPCAAGGSMTRPSPPATSSFPRAVWRLSCRRQGSPRRGRTA